MKRLAILMLFASACWPSAADAFWQRSQWAKCSEAPTEAERIRLNCYIFAPAYDWPMEYGGSFGAYRSGASLPPAPLPPTVRKY